MGFSMTRRIDAAGFVIALLLLAIAGMIWFDMTSLQISSVYGLGPKAMPMIVAVGLGLLAIGNAIMAVRGELPARDSLDWRPIILIIGGMAVLIALIRFGGGFIFATAILFATTSAAFGRRAFLADLAIGFVISVIIYILFSKLLTLSLPVGPLERLI
jgi:putative tricarboxylic transport membrane protein